eukprot:UN19434
MKSIALMKSFYHAVNVFSLYSGFYSTYCIPLKLLIKCNGWDPWLMQEDNLMLMRCYLATEGKLNVSLLRSNVYNIPASSMKEYWCQTYYRLINEWFAIGYYHVNYR